jgi:hypothetical protein
MRLASLTAFVLLAACGGNGNNNQQADASLVIVDAPIGDGPLGGGADARPGGTTDGAPLVNDAGQALCNEGGVLVVCECSDGVNNDSDTFIDSADPECTGPFDNDEGSFATGIPGDNSDPYAQDCFFDGDSGGGNDGCRWDIRCEEPPNGQHCNNTQLAGCDKCRPLVPNGCDCFGCCDVFVDGVSHTVRIIDTCTADEIDNETLCPPCTKVEACVNPCDPCEVCIGRPDPDPSCMPPDGGTGNGQCPAGITPCTPPDNTCPAEFRCVTGCCVRYLSKQ